jgi:hypothetical protein
MRRRKNVVSPLPPLVGDSSYPLFLSLPRVRCDGVYICRCHYLRQGVDESAWSQPIHIVTYYRYLVRSFTLFFWYCESKNFVYVQYELFCTVHWISRFRSDFILMVPL